MERKKVELVDTEVVEAIAYDLLEIDEPNVVQVAKEHGVTSEIVIRIQKGQHAQLRDTTRQNLLKRFAVGPAHAAVQEQTDYLKCIAMQVTRTNDLLEKMIGIFERQPVVPEPAQAADSKPEKVRKRPDYTVAKPISKDPHPRLGEAVQICNDYIGHPGRPETLDDHQVKEHLLSVDQSFANFIGNSQAMQDLRNSLIGENGQYYQAVDCPLWRLRARNSEAKQENVLMLPAKAEVSVPKSNVATQEQKESHALLLALYQLGDGKFKAQTIVDRLGHMAPQQELTGNISDLMFELSMENLVEESGYVQNPDYRITKKGLNKFLRSA